MNKTHKKLALISIAAFVIEAAVVIGVAINLSGNILSPIRASNSNQYSVSFDRSNDYSASGTTYTYKNKTSSGEDIFLVSTDGLTRQNNQIARVPSMYESTDILVPTLKLYKDSDAALGFRFQSITSVKVVTSASITLSVQTSADDFTYREKGTFNASSSGGTFSTFNEYDRFILLTISAKKTTAVNITSVEVSYECESKSESFVSGHYHSLSDNNTDMDLYINSDHYGYYTYLNSSDSTLYYTLFTWTYDSNNHVVTVSYTSTPGGSISGKTSTGTQDKYEKFCLFDRFSSKDVRKTRVSIFDGTVSLFFNTTAGSSVTAESARRETATIMNVVS